MFILMGRSWWNILRHNINNFHQKNIGMENLITPLIFLLKKKKSNIPVFNVLNLAQDWLEEFEEAII